MVVSFPARFLLCRFVILTCAQGVTAIVRVCEPTYEAAEVEKAGIAMHDMPFDDGTVPPKDVLTKWRGLVKGAEASGGKVAIHCVAGLGRAPVMVAIALIDKVSIVYKYECAWRCDSHLCVVGFLSLLRSTTKPSSVVLDKAPSVAQHALPRAQLNLQCALSV